MENIKRLHSEQTLFLDKPPCCLEFCPSNPKYFVVGTYNLNDGEEAAELPDDSKREQKRDGSLLLYTLVDGKMQLRHGVKTPYGVLDVHFSPHHVHLLAVATSTGSCSIYACFGTQEELEPRYVQTFQLFERNVVTTSVAWDTQQDSIIYVSASNGKVVRFVIPESAVRNPSSYEKISEEPLLPVNVSEDGFDDNESIYEHELEAWTVICTPSTWSQHQVFSGGDDATIIGSNLRNKRIHQAGVTAILPLTERIIATGSYDDHMRIIRLPDENNRRSDILCEINLGGGVWRLKPLDSLPRTASEKFCIQILVSCMYAGAFIVKLHGGPEMDDWLIEVVAHFAEHESMNYACDVQPSVSKDIRTIVSCSFYDRRLCLWNL